jgi:hypothetical protein
MDERITDLPEWAQKRILNQEKEIDYLKKIIGKLYGHSEGMVKIFASINTKQGAKNR